MGALYDALRKAEAEHKKAAGPGIPKNIKVLGLLIAMVVVVAFGLYRIKSSWGETKPPAALQTSGGNQASGVKAAPVKPRRAPGTYELDGVIDGQYPLAIINDKLLKPGGKIDNLILKKISSREVELLNTANNSTVILKIQ